MMSGGCLCPERFLGVVPWNYNALGVVSGDVLVQSVMLKTLREIKYFPAIGLCYMSVDVL